MSFQNSEHPKLFPGVIWGPTQNLGSIGSAVLTFIGYKQTDKQTDKQSLYIDVMCDAILKLKLEK